MKEKAFRKVKQNNGFTMMEMLVVIAVTVILLGISILAISGMVTRLKMTELDNYAKTIYLEAQNQLAAKEIEGGLPGFYDDIVYSYESHFLQKMPQDYDETVNGNAWRQLCYLAKQDDITTELIPTSSNIYQMESHYLIEVNPQTGDIYGVFYWEEEEPISYTNHIQALEDRELETRTEAKLGYYGGAASSTTVSTNLELDQQVELINSEELYLKVSYKMSSRLLQYYDSALQVKYTIEDEHENIWEGTMDLGDCVEGERLEFYFLLDSMEEGYGFADITQNTLVPGDNLTITVTGEFSQGAYYCIEESNPVSGNSLFAGKTPIAQNSAGTEIQVACVRHLRNLNEGYYVHTAEDSDLVTIKQSDDIDFRNTDFAWEYGAYWGAGKVVNPMKAVTPIKNSMLFENEGGADATSIDGNGFEIKNFVVEANVLDETNTGLFATAENVNFHNIRLEDITVTGYTNVGALAGSVSGGKVVNCGVYLSTYSESGGSKQFYSQNVYTNGLYDNEMQERYDTRRITGTTNVGGLFGSISGISEFQDSFAAIKVAGTTNVGGIIGTASGSTIQNCYASGDVTGTGSTIGGFIGNVSGVTVRDAYATSNIYGADKLGGFLGAAENSYFDRCYAYGAVLDVEGNTNLSNAGGFIHESTSVSNTYGTCKYLMQSAHNDSTLLVDADGIEVGLYGGMTASSDAALTPEASFPYDAILMYKAFPFTKVTSHHYGDWPLQHVIDNSLVYYEKYMNADGKSYRYGYYCETTLSSKEDNDTVSDYTWILDTLEDTECVEDGYAILSMYNLSGFEYELRVGSLTDAEIDETLAANTTLKKEDFYKTGSLTVSGTAGKGKAVLLRQQGELVFKGYDTSGNEVNEFTASGMYLYQLPYELQCTARTQVENFYDIFTVYNGKARGNDDTDSTPVLGGTSVSEGVSFYYCPHFAKTAINPNMDTSEEVGEDGKLTNPAEVYVRSARQLNALGRYSYYWNDKQNLDAMVYVQETDINFGTYTKNYCGQVFDLMDTDGPVANKPIGVPAYSDTAEQFRNTYDGRSNKIIDYCLESDEQFVGLFGEIQDATLKNIVMTVSKEGAGKITAEFYDEDISDSNTKRAGVGALVGLAYQDGNTITNCVSVGYTVEYQINEVPAASTEMPNPGHPTGIAAGGLAGFSICNMNNCAAENDIRLIVNHSYEYDNSHDDGDGGVNGGAVFLGGLVGSYFYKSMQNAYSGGTIGVEVNGDSYVHRLRIGGLTPGYLNIGAGQDTNLFGGATYNNVYSYTEILDSVWENRAALGNFNHLIPVVGRMTWSENASTSCATGTVSVPNAWYLDYIYEDALETYISEDAKNYFVEHKHKVLGITVSTHGKTCDPISYEGLSAITSFGQKIASSKNCHPLNSLLEDRIYPFPEVIYDVLGVDADGNEIIGDYIHYGDWPVESHVVDASYPAYYEEYSDGTYGIYYLEEDGTAVSTLITDDSLEITNTGYGVFTLQPQLGSTVVTTKEINGYIYHLTHVELSVNTEHMAFGEWPFTFEKLLVEDKNVIGTNSQKEVTLYANEHFGAALSLSEDLGTSAKPLQVRTQEQLLNVDKVADTDVYMKQTHSITLTEDYIPVTVQSTNYYDGGGGESFAIKGASNTVFAANDGTITNTVVMNSNITSTEDIAVFVYTNNGTITASKVIGAKLTSERRGAGFVFANNGTISESGVYAEGAYDNVMITGGRAYGFVDINSGTITECYATGTVQGIDGASGFVGTNQGRITYSYANAQVQATARRARAAGFAVTSEARGRITTCYSAGSVSGFFAYGFMQTGNAVRCYTISAITGTRLFGFAGEDSSLQFCYWGHDIKVGYNANVYENGEGAGTGVSLRVLKAMNDFETASDSDLPYTAELGTNYPYPSVGIAHYGDWPVASEKVQNNTIYRNVLNTDEANAAYAAIVYYERYTDGTYGIYAEGCTLVVGNQPTFVMNTLASEDEPVVESGYGVLTNNRAWSVGPSEFDWRRFQSVEKLRELEDFSLERVRGEYKLYDLGLELQDSFTYYLRHGDGVSIREAVIEKSELTRPTEE